MDPKQYGELRVKPFVKNGKKYKGQLFLEEKDKRINILHGAVRSTKTYASILKFIRVLLECRHDSYYFLFTGTTYLSMERNIIIPFLKICNGAGISDIVNIDYKRKDHIIFNDNIIWLKGINDEGAYSTVPGMSLRGWLGDEVKFYPKKVFDEIYHRLSEPGAVAYLTFNSDNPHHYIYEDYVYNQRLVNESIVSEWNFSLFDNPHLDEDYINSLLIKYPEGSGEYKLYVLGLPVASEGLIL